MVLLCASFALGISSAEGREYGLVVGINDYIHLSASRVPGQHSDLEGAVNDATVIAAALRRRAVSLPEDRFLIDHRATAANFREAFERMANEAQPGDTLIITFAGHGGQERENAAPFDEIDGRDETLMFADFDPKDARVGRINDDQLHALLKQYPQFRIILVMDSCHSAGLERSITAGRGGLHRSGGLWDIPIEPIADAIEANEGEASSPPLAHVTQILATATEDRLVQETRFEGKPHGALSWFFARALDGEADADGDGALSGTELTRFLSDRIFTAMEQNQQPRFLPRGGAGVLIGAQAVNVPSVAIQKPTVKANIGPTPVKIVGHAPPDIAAGECADCLFVDNGAALTFEEAIGGWHVYNKVGDRIGFSQSAGFPYVQRSRFLDGLDAAKSIDIEPIQIEALQSADRHPIGAEVGFRFVPPDDKHVFLTLFNIASSGVLQYPIHGRDFDPLARVGASPFSLTFEVVPPTGADQLVSIWCVRPPLSLHDLLATDAKSLVANASVYLDHLSDNQCQVGRIGLFTGDS